MKRTLLALFAALSLSLFAGWQRIGTLQVADMPAQGAAVSQVGMFFGNPLASAAMAAAIADAPTLKFFGPMRAKSSMVFSLFIDGKKLAEKPSDAFESLEYALLYPVSLARGEFLKRHPGAVEKDGAIVVNASLDGDDDDGERTFVVFSADGRWAAASDRLSQAKLALEDAAVAEKPLDGDVARLRLGSRGIKAVAASAAEAKDADREFLELLGTVKSVVCGLRVSDLGVDVRGAVRLADGSPLASCGLRPLGEKPLAFADKSAVAASAEAADSGSSSRVSDRQWTDSTNVCRACGLDLARFLVREKTASGERYTLDLAALVKLVTDTSEKKGFADVDFEKLVDRLGEIDDGKKFSVKSPPYSCSCRLKGFESQWTPGERFAATLPEAAARKPFAVSFVSFSSIVKATVPHILPLVPEEQRPAVKPMLEMIGVEQKRGIAAMAWNEKGALRFMLRVSADEFKGIGSLVSAAMAASMCGPSSDSDDGDSLDDDDEDDED